MCTQKRIFDHLINRYGIPADLLMSVLHLYSCKFFSDLWGRSLWGTLFCALRFPVRLRRFVWISPGLWFCDRSEIESKSSGFRCLSLRRLVASNLGRYKAIYPLFSAKLSLFLNLLSWRSGHPCARIYRHLSCGNQSYRCHGRFLLSPTYLSFVYHLLLFSSVSYICFAISYSPLKSHTKKSYSLLLVLMILCCLHSSCCLLVTIVALPPYSC